MKGSRSGRVPLVIHKGVCELSRGVLRDGRLRLRKSHGMSIGNPGQVPGEIDPDVLVPVPLRELTAAFSIVALVRNMVGGSDGPLAEGVARGLTGIGRVSADTHLPATDVTAEAPRIDDRETAHEYLSVLLERLRNRRPA